MGTFVRILGLCLVLGTNSQTLYSGCDTTSYYDELPGSGTQDWTRVDLHQLVRSTHQNSLPYTDNSGREDVWDALIDLDRNIAGQEASLVRLIYGNIDVPAIPFGDPENWNREHLWPKSRGVEGGGMDFTDVHHLRPSDWNVNAARGNLFFGGCGLFEISQECQIPANDEAASDTAADGVVWLPPSSVRGDIARAMFYMELRYDGDGGEVDLTLTDCPSNGADNEMAYLSQLLEWHLADPPDDDERERNSRICERWQGNRNPFVDFFDLATSLYGSPQSVLEGQFGYNCSDGPVITNNGTCEGLDAGDIMVAAVNSDNPDVVALVALSHIPAGTPLYITDNAWTGTEFRSNEGILKLIVPDGGISAGTIFGYDIDSSVLYGDSWQAEDLGFALAAAGDTILVYCQSDSGNLVHISGFSYSGSWVAGGMSDSEYGTSNSALPSALVDVGAVALPHFDNYMYIGKTTGTKADLQKALMNGNNWLGLNSERHSTVNIRPFVVQGPDTSVATKMVDFSCHWLLALFILVRLFSS